MSENRRDDVLESLQKCLSPIAEFSLRAGISYQDFEMLAKAAFVSTAFDNFGVRGRATNVSRVAVITGLSRKEVSRIREATGERWKSSGSAGAPAALVLAGWHTDDKFVDEDGRPLALSFEDASPSFSELVKTYGGDVTAGSVRSELKRAGAIHENDDRTLVPLKRYFVPAEIDDKLATSVGIMLYGLAATIAHNSNPDREGSGRIQRFVYSDTLGPAATRLFRNVARQRAEQFVENLDDWLASNQGLTEIEAEQGAVPRRVGVGVYYFEQEASAAGESNAEKRTADE